MFSKVFKANPKGINQYTKGSAKAIAEHHDAEAAKHKAQMDKETSGSDAHKKHRIAWAKQGYAAETARLVASGQMHKDVGKTISAGAADASAKAWSKKSDLESALGL